MLYLIRCLWSNITNRISACCWWFEWTNDKTLSTRSVVWNETKDIFTRHRIFINKYEKWLTMNHHWCNNKRQLYDLKIQIIRSSLTKPVENKGKVRESRTPNAFWNARSSKNNPNVCNWSTANLLWMFCRKRWYTNSWYFWSMHESPYL